MENNIKILKIKDKKKSISIFLGLFFFFCFTSSVYAQILDGEVGRNVQKNASVFTQSSGMSLNPSLGSYMQTIITGFLSILGIIFIILIIIAGFNWMTANGDEGKVTKAKETIMRAVIGLIIMVAAYAITVFVFSSIDVGGGGEGSLHSVSG